MFILSLLFQVLRGGSVVFLVASLGAAGMYTCAGKAPGKLLALAFYAGILYMMAAVYIPKWWCGIGGGEGIGGGDGGDGGSGGSGGSGTE